MQSQSAKQSVTFKLRAMVSDIRSTFDVRTFDEPAAILGCLRGLMQDCTAGKVSHAFFKGQSKRRNGIIMMLKEEVLIISGLVGTRSHRNSGYFSPAHVQTVIDASGWSEQALIMNSC